MQKKKYFQFCCVLFVRLEILFIDSFLLLRCVHFLFFFVVCTSTGAVKFCAFCEILFTKYKANIENNKLKRSRKTE